MIKVLTPVVFSLVLFGCGGNVKEGQSLACEGVNWKKVGHEAVAANKPVRYFDKYKNACGSKLEAGAIKLYQDGYAQASVEVCTEENGQSFGLAGKKPLNVCLFELKEKFLNGYKLGKIERQENMAELRRISEEQSKGSIEATAPATPDSN